MDTPEGEPAGGAAARDRWTDAGIVLALMVLYAAAYAYLTVFTDTARDVGVAWRIAHGQELPLYGPHIGGRWRLGPVWYYVLAALTAPARSMTAVSLGVGALASLKFPFAYVLGRRVAGRGCGLAWVALLALPGWDSIEQAIFTHFNLVQAMVLATLLAAHSAWRRPSAARWVLVGMALSLALHAHPTAVVAAPAVLLAWWGSRTRGVARSARAAAVLVVGGVLPLVPMLVAEARSGFGQFGTTVDFVGGGGFGARLAESPALLVAFARNDLRLASALLAPLGWAGAAIVAGTVAALAIGAVAALTIRAGLPLRARWWLAGYFVASIAGLSALRHPASVYFFYATLPLGTGVAALGWVALSERLAPRRRALPGLALAGFALLASAGMLAARAGAWREGWQRLPGVLVGNVAATPAPGMRPLDLLPVFALDAIGRAVCDAPAGLTVHGDAGTLLEIAQALPTWLACGPRDNLRVGGLGPPLAGYPVGLWREAGVALPAHARGYLWFRELEAFDTGGQQVVLCREYPPQLWRPKPMLEWSASKPVESGDWIAITRLNPQLTRTREPELELDGVRIAPTVIGRNTWLYAVEAAGLLRVRVVTDDATWLDVVRLRAEAALNQL